MSAHRPLAGLLAGLGVLAAGLLFSAVPALAAPPEEPVTKAATLITGTTATLNGELNPGASSQKVIYVFLYGTGSEPCGGSVFGVPEPFGETEGNHIAVAGPLTNLVPNTEYGFCLVAFNSEFEEARGGSLSFKTLAVKPVVAGESTSGVTPFATRLHAEVNPENQATSCVFEYGQTTAYGISAPCEPATLEGSTVKATSSPLSGLESATTYHYRVVVQNATGETKGPDGEFTTLSAEKPTVASESVSGLTSTDATLEAKVNPNFQESACEFVYGTNPVLGGSSSVPCQPEHLGEGSSPVGATAALIALQPRTTYYYQVVATNNTGPTDGPIQAFTTLATPAVTTGAANTPTRTTAVLTGTVNPSGAETTSHFAYVAAGEYEPLAANPYAKGLTTPQTASIGSDYTVHTINPPRISELKPGVTYHYALIATNSLGTTPGSDMEFTTSPPTPPLAVTGEAVAVTPSSATITGSVDTRELPTTLQFEFGAAPGAGFLVPATVVPGAGSGSTVGISETFSGSLQPSTTYYYRTVATNSDGTTHGAERSLTTGSFPGLPGGAPAQLIAWPPFVAAALAAAELHEPSSTSAPKPLTKAQKLAKALKACSKKPKRRRASCRRQAKRRYR